jgi:hypothetical protein
MSVAASKLGADSSFVASPANTKVGCWLVLVVAPLPADVEGRKSIQGTATCLPAAVAVLEEDPRLVPLPPAALLSFKLVVPDEAPLKELVPLGLAAPPVPPEELSDKIANSTRPEPGLMIRSLIAPISVPELLIT